MKIILVVAVVICWSCVPKKKVQLVAPANDEHIAKVQNSKRLFCNRADVAVANLCQSSGSRIVPVLWFDHDIASILCDSGAVSLSDAILRLPNNFQCDEINSSHYLRNIDCDSLVAVVYTLHMDGKLLKHDIYPNQVRLDLNTSRSTMRRNKERFSKLKSEISKGGHPFLLKGLVTGADYFVFDANDCYGFFERTNSYIRIEELYQAQYVCGVDEK